MDGVLADFERAAKHVRHMKGIGPYRSNDDKDIDLALVEGFFRLLPPVPGAIEAYNKLRVKYDTYILSSPPHENPSAWKEKSQWVREHLPEAEEDLILCRHKNLLKGDYLIDDRLKRGVMEFEGEHLHFGEGKDFGNWQQVLGYLL
jgi:5'(3')-deoxyribonucleotidase